MISADILETLFITLFLIHLIIECLVVYFDL